MANSTEDSDAIRNKIVEYVLDNHPSSYSGDTMPLDESLGELGVLDSYGVVELVDFLENTWSIKIKDEEITREKIGSVNKMVTLVIEKNPVSRVAGTTG